MDQPAEPESTEDPRKAVLGAWVGVLVRAGLLDQLCSRRVHHDGNGPARGSVRRLGDH